MATSYEIGTGIAEVTDPAVGLPMQGMADRNQVTAGVESRLYARAFVIADSASVTAAGRVAIVVVDIWSATRRVKDAVLEGLSAAHGDVYIEENVLLAGTHTHSAPGGYSGALVYDFDFERGGCDDATVRCISDGCVRAVEVAHASLAPGRIYVNRGDVVDCGRSRSVAAYMCNPQAERDRWGADTDRELLLLKFVKVDGGGDERPVGVLSWYHAREFFSSSSAAVRSTMIATSASTCSGACWRPARRGLSKRTGPDRPVRCGCWVAPEGRRQVRSLVWPVSRECTGDPLLGVASVVCGREQA